MGIAYNGLAMYGRFQGYAGVVVGAVMLSAVAVFLAVYVAKPAKPGEPTKRSKLAGAGVILAVMSSLLMCSVCWASLLRKSKPLAAASGGASLVSDALTLATHQW